MALLARPAALWGRELHRLAEHRAAWEDPAPGPDRDYTLAGVRHVVHGHSPACDFAIHRLANRYWIDCGAQFCDRPDVIAGWAARPRLCLVDLDAPGTPL